jgi:hypothetical protein
MQLTPRDKKLLQIMAVVLPVFLIVWFLFLRPDGGEDVAIDIPTGPTGGLPTGPTGPTATESPRETLPPIELAGERDPFSIPPGLEPEGGSVGPTETASPTVSPTISPTVSPTISPTVSPTTSPSPTPPPDEEPSNKILIGGHEVKLVSVSNNGNKAEIKVDRKLWTVEVGATFDDNFKLVDIDGDCAKLLYGDQSFELCLLGSG